MRCTKCSYLSFEPEPRCRNCGHDLSIDDLSLGELSLKPLAAAEDDEADPLGEFDLDLSTDEPSAPAVSMHRSSLSREEAGGVATMTPPVIARPLPEAPPTSELPLFVRDLVEPDEELEPLVKVPPRPRPPLAVRRTTPDPAKLRARYAPTHTPDLLDAMADVTEAPVLPTPFHGEPVLHPTEEPVHFQKALPTPIATGQRVAAAAIDLGVLGVIAIVVIVFTLRLAELPMAGVLDLPVVPMLAFFALIGLGYELMFTAASGQTIGKMVMGLRVVPDEPHAEADRVPVRQACLRAVSMLPLGAGLVAAFVGHGLAVHDRVAHTRVVRV